MTKRYQRFITMVVVLQLTACPIQSVDWKKNRGNMKGVSIGDGGVWGVTSDNRVIFSKGSYQNQAAGGSGWMLVDGKLNQVDVGGNVVWGVDKNHDVFVRIGISPYTPVGMGWRRVCGRKLKYVSVSDKGHVWGVTSNGNVVRRRGASFRSPLGYDWQDVKGSMKQLSVGFSGVWAVNDHDDIFYRTGTYGDSNSEGTGWKKVGGKLKYISSGLGVVIGTSKPDEIFTRNGVSVRNPAGSGWTTLNGRLRMVEGYDYGSYWGVTSGNEIFHTHG